MSLLRPPRPHRFRRLPIHRSRRRRCSHPRIRPSSLSQRSQGPRRPCSRPRIRPSSLSLRSQCPRRPCSHPQVRPSSLFLKSRSRRRPCSHRRLRPKSILRPRFLGRRRLDLPPSHRRASSCRFRRDVRHSRYMQRRRTSRGIVEVILRAYLSNLGSARDLLDRRQECRCHSSTLGIWPRIC